MPQMMKKKKSKNDHDVAHVYSEAFVRSLYFALQWEGGYSDDPFDPGGATQLGVTIGTLKRWWRFLKRDRTPTPEDVKKLTPEEAHKIYHVWYWTPCRCEDMPPAIGLPVMDCAINQGPGRAPRLLQKTLGVKVDGIIGSKTLAAIHDADLKGLIRDFMARRAVHYSSLPTILRFGYGWFRRIFAAQQAALELVPKGKG